MDEFDDIVLDDYTFDTEPTTTAPDTTTAEPDTLVPEEPKKPEKIKFNESLLLETKGVPLLKNESQYIRFQGKGHEAADLKRLITYYTVWANNLYPKFRFKDFARRVQKPASGARLKVMVEAWQDEHRGRVQARREVLQELSGETVGDVDGENQREEEESSDDDNRPLFFPISEEAAEAMKKNKAGKKKTKSSTTTKSSNNKYRSRDTINSSDEDESDNESSQPNKSQPRTITFSDSEDEGEAPIRKKKSDPAPAVNGRAHALAILAEKRKQKLQAQQGAKPQEVEPPKEKNNEEEETHVRKRSNRNAFDDDTDEEDYDETLRKILVGKPTDLDDVELAKSGDELDGDIPMENEEPNDPLDDIVMEDVSDII